MDDKGGWRDKVVVELLWRSIKYAEPGYDSIFTAKAGIAWGLSAAVTTSMRCDWHKGAYCTLGGGR